MRDKRWFSPLTTALLMKLFSRVSAALVAASLSLAAPAQAQITWNWSFANESGQFITNGSAPGGVAAAGTYTFTDFIVSGTGSGASLGSYSGGQYSASGFSTTLPYSFDWTGSSVSTWNSAGSNLFDWWVFQDTAHPNNYYFFGWQQGNTNYAGEAAYYDQNVGISQSSHIVDVSVSNTVPEPSTIALLAIGGAAILLVRRRRAA